MWFRPHGGSMTWEWTRVSYTSTQDLARQIRDRVRVDLPGLNVQIDTSRLDGSVNGFGVVTFEREDIATFGFYRHHRPEQRPPSLIPVAAEPDDPAGPALFAPPPPPLHIPTGGTLT
jgi:hypothetical protein